MKLFPEVFTHHVTLCVQKQKKNELAFAFEEIMTGCMEMCKMEKD